MNKINEMNNLTNKNNQIICNSINKIDNSINKINETNKNNQIEKTTNKNDVKDIFKKLKNKGIILDNITKEYKNVNLKFENSINKIDNFSNNKMLIENVSEKKIISEYKFQNCEEENKKQIFYIENQFIDDLEIKMDESIPEKNLLLISELKKKLDATFMNKKNNLDTWKFIWEIKIKNENEAINLCKLNMLNIYAKKYLIPLIQKGIEKTLIPARYNNYFNMCMYNALHMITGKNQIELWREIKNKEFPSLNYPFENYCGNEELTNFLNKYEYCLIVISRMGEKIFLSAEGSLTKNQIIYMINFGGHWEIPSIEQRKIYDDVLAEKLKSNFEETIDDVTIEE
jgi:hypothetical protein